MTVGTGFTAIGFAIFLNRFFQRNDTQAGFAGAFHLSYGSHSIFLKTILQLL
jgi:hypothetical protein